MNYLRASVHGPPCAVLCAQICYLQISVHGIYVQGVGGRLVNFVSVASACRKLAVIMSTQASVLSPEGTEDEPESEPEGEVGAQVGQKRGRGRPEHQIGKYMIKAEGKA